MNIKTTHDLVKEILVKSEAARNSDRKLYVEVIRKTDPGLLVAPFEYVMLVADIPSFETVRRARQKIQATHEELRAADKVQDYRAANEEEFFKYALDK